MHKYAVRVDKGVGEGGFSGRYIYYFVNFNGRQEWNKYQFQHTSTLCTANCDAGILCNLSCFLLAKVTPQIMGYTVCILHPSPSHYGHMLRSCARDAMRCVTLLLPTDSPLARLNLH
jgi:hypothetical protein